MRNINIDQDLGGYIMQATSNLNDLTHNGKLIEVKTIASTTLKHKFKAYFIFHYFRIRYVSRLQTF
jgi:hypothetical protein